MGIEEEVRGRKGNRERQRDKEGGRWQEALERLWEHGGKAEVS